MKTLRAVFAIFRTQGLAGVLSRTGDRLSRTAGKSPIPVRREDALAVDLSKPHPAVATPLRVKGRSLTVAWIMSPPGESSGGHQNIFRFIEYLERAGHHARIYFYSVGSYSLAQVREMLETSPAYPRLAASMEVYNGRVADDVDAIFATSWETAYPSFLDASPARRLYFVQDFEPYFYPVGTESVLAENTYRFGFEAITAGGWLAHTLNNRFGMKTSHFDFSADRAVYHVSNDGPRREVFFYARPGTERRGFELGIMALELFSQARPDYTINLVGWDVARFDIPFPHVNLRAMPISELNEVYNRCAVGLVLSMTNMSLLPLELIAAGVIPVVNDGENNSMVTDNPYIEYTPAWPRALADRLIAIVDRADLPEHARAAAASLPELDWDRSGARFVELVEGAMRG